MSKHHLMDTMISLAQELLQKRGHIRGAFRTGELEIHGDRGPVSLIALHESDGPRALVYALGRDYDAESDLREEDKAPKVYYVRTFNEQYADGVIAILQKELVLDRLADV